MAATVYCVCFQGVEFFDEKLNALFMAWLLDHGIKSLMMFIFVNCEHNQVL